MLDAIRGPWALVSLGGSYLLRRPLRVVGAMIADLPLPLAAIAAPLAGVWSAAHIARALATGIGIGWRVRSAPVLRPNHALIVAPGQIAPICSLVTDTHLTSEGKIPCELELDPGQWPFRALPTSEILSRGIRQVLTHIHATAPRTVIWCGDEVDTGSPSEWAHWKAAVDAVPGLAHRVVPGNHDVCFNLPFDEDYRLARRAKRERAFQAHGDRLADYPVVDTIVGDNGSATVLLLDSTKHRSQHILSNAIGSFGDVQLDEVDRILATRSGPVLCITHHHVWRDAKFLQPDEWYNTTVDAARLARILLAYRRRDAKNQVLVCHGHRHALIAGTISDGDVSIDVVGLPSTTLGDKSVRGILDGVLRYAIAGLRPDGVWGVALVPVGAVVATEQPRRPTPRSVPSVEVRALSPRVPGCRTTQTG